MEATALEELELQHTLDRKRSALERVAHEPAAAKWAQAAPATESGTAKLYEALEQHMARPEFAEELARSQHEALAAAGGVGQQQQQRAADGEERHGGEEVTGDYIVVEREDVIEALSAFIAAYIVSLPDARNLDPRTLQRAVVQTLAELRKGRVRRLWDWGRCFYRAGVVAYGAFSMFSNPWVAKALVAALWTAVRMMGRVAFGV
eukprot:scaffold3.g6511.t1